ncbi:hypothetical protein Ga0100231_013885 [Opitutaceae bacterium TAV4]|nr:hypothetical protein Ga0100231_013885 [Opitutaceae bacterium TAV4]
MWIPMNCAPACARKALTCRRKRSLMTDRNFLPPAKANLVFATRRNPSPQETIIFPCCLGCGIGGGCGMLVLSIRMKSLFTFIPSAIGLALLSMPGLASADFPKPEPEKFMAEFKIFQRDGGVFRTPREDWASARRRTEEKPAWRTWLEARRAETDTWMLRHCDRVEWRCGKNSRFVSPRDGSDLVWTDEMPGEQTQTLKSKTGHEVEVTPEIQAAWIYHFRRKHMDMMTQAARLFRLTGEERYAQWAAGQLDFYADNYEQWPAVQLSADNWARLSSHGLNDAQFLGKLAETARLLFDWAGEARRHAWFEKLFKPEVELLDRSFQNIHNIAVWHRAAQAQVGLLYGDEDIWKRQMDGPWGLREQFRKGVTGDYLWYEQSLSYNAFIIRAMMPLLVFAGLTEKKDQLAQEAAIVQNMSLAPLRMAFPDGTLPNPSDVTGSPPRASNMLARFVARVLPTTISNEKSDTSLNWENLVDPPKPKGGNIRGTLPGAASLNLESTRFAIIKKGHWQVFFHYGQLTSAHAQSEALNWSANYNGVNISSDPGTVGYGSPFHSEYYTQGLCHNVPLVNGRGQKPPQPGKLLRFDAERGEVSAAQSKYRPNVSARRTLRIEGDALVDEATVAITEARQTAQLGLALHFQGKTHLPQSFLPVDDFAKGRTAAFKYWKDVRAASFRDNAEIDVTFPGGLVMRVRFSVPGEFTLYQGRSPGRPSQSRFSFYLETSGRETVFTTRLTPVRATTTTTTGVARSFIVIAAAGEGEETSRVPVIMLRSGWGTANIGDIAHTPGLLSLLEHHIPEAKLILWGVKMDRGVGEKLRRQFPNVKFVSGKINAERYPDTPELAEAFEEADLLLHGSAPNIHVTGDFLAWRKRTGKPYGYYGVTLDYKTLFAQFMKRQPPAPEIVDLINHSAFLFFRDSVSMNEARKDGIRAPNMRFVPDAAFGARQYDTGKADAWMRTHGLEPGKFICVIARTRFAPYWSIHNRQPEAGTEQDRADYNAHHMPSDYGKIREAIILWIRKTGLKVALVPEMVFEMELHKKEILDHMPEDVRPFIVWREDYWMPDEAAAVYKRAIALMSMECHSPIIATATGTPSLYLTTPTETYKKNMWPDIGLGDWMLELDEQDGPSLADALLRLTEYPDAARKKLWQAMNSVKRQQRDSMEIVRRTVFEQVRKKSPQNLEPL